MALLHAGPEVTLAVVTYKKVEVEKNIGWLIRVTCGRLPPVPPHGFFKCIYVLLGSYKLRQT